MLSDMVSKLTLIQETTSRPLPFVDEIISQKFLSCLKLPSDTTENSGTDDIRALQDCFQRYFKPETLSGENSFDCYYCRSLDQTQSMCFCRQFFQRKNTHNFYSVEKVLTEATRQTVFFQLPPVLPIFLKRFQMVSLLKISSL